MASLSIAQYTKNKNIRLSLAYNSKTGLYYYKGEWIDSEKLNEVLPIDLLPAGISKNVNPDRNKNFVHGKNPL